MKIFSARETEDDTVENPSPCREVPQKAERQETQGSLSGSHCRILEDHTIGEAKTGDLAGIFGYDIYYNKTNYELAYTVEYVEDKIIVIIMAGTRENFYNELKRYMRG